MLVKSSVAGCGYVVASRQLLIGTGGLGPPTASFRERVTLPLSYVPFVSPRFFYWKYPARLCKRVVRGRFSQRVYEYFVSLRLLTSASTACRRVRFRRFMVVLPSCWSDDPPAWRLVGLRQGLEAYMPPRKPIPMAS